MQEGKHETRLVGSTAEQCTLVERADVRVCCVALGDKQRA